MDPKLLDIAAFTDAPPSGYVRRKGKVFEVGDYPEKRFSLTEEEADRAIANFTPVPGDLEHMPTVLNGNLGIMRRVTRGGRAIFGEADIPEWLDNVLKGSASGVSLAWDRAEKTIKGWGWTLDPHVGGAALMSAYAEFSRVQASVPVNTLPPIQPRPLRNTKEKRMKLGEILAQKTQALFSGAATPPPADTSTPTITPPATQPTQPTTPPATPPVQAPAPTVTPAPAPTPTVPTPPTPVAQFSAPGSADDDLDAATADFRSNQIINNATRIADELIASGHVHSSGRPALIVAFSNAGLANEAGPALVTFSRQDGTIVNDHVELLREAFEHTPKHALFASTLPVQVFNGSKGAHEQKSAEQIGKEQAEKWNRDNAQLIPAAPATNGNGNGVH